MSRHTFLLLLAPLTHWSCRTKSAKPDAVRRYSLAGSIVRIDPQSKSVAIKHGAILDEKGGVWMEAMTMDYPVRDPGDLARLQVGQQIRATVHQRESDYEYWVGEIQISGKESQP